MASKRSFSSPDTPKKAEDYHGMASYARTTPDVAAKGVDSVNLYFDFDEALKLAIAIQSCVMNLNRYKRSKGSAGRDMGLSLSVKIASKSVAVIETEV